MMRTLLAFVALTVLSSAALAQETPPPPENGTPHAPSAAVDAQSVESRLQALEQELARLRPLVDRHTGDLTSLRTIVEDNDRAIKGLIDSARENREAVAELRDLSTRNADAVAALQPRVADNDEKLRQIVTGSPSTGYMVDIVGKMTESPAFKAAVERATQGRLYVHNHSDVERTLYLNGSLWRARPGRTYIYAPVGTVTVHNSYGRPMPIDSAGWRYNAAAGYWEMDYHF